MNKYKLKVAGKTILFFETNGLNGYGMRDIENALKADGRYTIKELAPNGIDDKENDLFNLETPLGETFLLVVTYL